MTNVKEELLRNEMPDDDVHMPAYVRIGLREARCGGINSYSDVGWHVGIHLHSVIEENFGSLEADEAVIELEAAFAEEAIYEAMALATEYLPNILRQIPLRRWPSFMKGIYHAFQEDRLWN